MVIVERYIYIKSIAMLSAHVDSGIKRIHIVFHKVYAFYVSQNPHRL